MPPVHLLFLHNNALLSVEELLSVFLAVEMILKFTGESHALLGVPILGVVLGKVGGGIVQAVNLCLFIFQGAFISTKIERRRDGLNLRTNRTTI